MNKSIYISIVFLVAFGMPPSVLAEGKDANLKSVQMTVLGQHELVVARTLNSSYDAILPGSSLNLSSPTSKVIASQIEAQQDQEGQPFGSFAAVLAGIALVAGIAFKRISR